MYGNRYGKKYQEGFWDSPHYNSIKFANDKIDDALNDKIELYTITGQLKDPTKKEDYLTPTIYQTRYVKIGDSLEKEYKKFAEDVLMNISENPTTLENVINDWDITHEKKDISSLPYYKDYLKDVKQVVDKYRNDLSKLKLIKEGLERKTKLNESETATIGEFVKYAIKNLEIQKPPRNLTFSYDNEAAKEKRSFGYFDPNANKIWVYCGNRNMADILRTLAHELVHRKQDEDGRINYESGKTGSEIENEANAQAGILLRDFGKQHEEIYQ